ncbi:O-antigen ligase family protein [Massilibacteroides sp.]|uniref:O-antigen ligase family protein n=1 Tax=Massilibacteroides sp. TaxID=2034766 RepID=UPI002602854E|nr:O-antigen ligase family protein [Massilibacteroides sp.]MDD4515971.1 O-antigen ligase family protein [Massilibacteroides sp.]
MKRNSSFNIYTGSIILLFAIAPFVMAFDNMDRAELLSARILPSFIHSIANIIRWGLFFFMIMFSLYKITKKNRLFTITKPVFLLSVFYFVQFLYAIIDGTDYLRFFLMSLLSLLIPPFIGYALHKSVNVLRTFAYIILFFIVLSLIMNGHLLLSGYRFYGFMNNPNMYGISTVFWIVVLLLSQKFNQLNSKFYSLLFSFLILTMIFTGSRNAMVGLILILLFNSYQNVTKLMYAISFVFLLLFVVSYFVDLSFIFDRLFNIANAVQDSGRTAIWQRASHAINTNLWWGNGLDANYSIADTGNMHNCYIRFLLNMGVFFTVVSLLFYFGSIISVLIKRRSVPLLLGAFLLTFALMNIGEDYFIGLGSSIFIYILFIYGFINYFLTKDVVT